MPVHPDKPRKTTTEKVDDTKKSKTGDKSKKDKKV